MKTPIKSVVHATLAAVAIATSATAQTSVSGPPVVTVVRVPKPWYAPKPLVVGKMRDSIREYERIPGLAYKAYTLARADGRYGGLYLWTDRASAETWFNPAWFARVEKERGAPVEVRTFEARKIIDHTPGGTPADPRSSAVATIITMTVSEQAADRAADVRATLPANPGALLREVTVAGKGTAGVVLLWRDEAAATAALDESWRKRAASSLGAEPEIEWYDAPILLPSTLPANAIPAR